MDVTEKSAGEERRDKAKKRIETNVRRLRKTMRDDLDARGLVDPVYRLKLEEYLDLYRHRELAGLDVDETGLTVENANGTLSENPSARAERDYSRCMLNILKFFGLTTDKPVQNPADDEL